jgi:hypothetical protein
MWLLRNWPIPLTFWARGWGERNRNKKNIHPSHKMQGSCGGVLSSRCYAAVHHCRLVGSSLSFLVSPQAAVSSWVVVVPVIPIPQPQHHIVVVSQDHSTPHIHPVGSHSQQWWWCGWLLFWEMWQSVVVVAQVWCTPPSTLQLWSLLPVVAQVLLDDLTSSWVSVGHLGAKRNKVVVG